MSALCYLYFIILTYISFNFLYKPYGYIKSPFDKNIILKCTGLELFFVFIFSTGLIGLQPLLAIRLAMLEILCFCALFKVKEKPIFSFPMFFLLLFIIWVIIGFSYTVSIPYGIRMLLKYIYPLLVSLVASAIIRDFELCIKISVWLRILAIVGFVIYSVPFLRLLSGGAFWHQAALATHCGVISLLSLTLVFYTREKSKNILLFIVTAMVPFVWVFRTNIMELMVGVSLFFFMKYHIKSLPVIVLMAVLSVASIFYIPAVKKKMFFKPDEVTLESYLKGEVEENDVNTSGRQFLWEDITGQFENHPIIGNGSGFVQHRFYEVYTGWRKGGQLHNDMLVMLCDNGIVGFVLYVLATVGIFIHCFIVYRMRKYGVPIKMLALIAGPSSIAVFLTMYSDNTLSYSMCTLSYPWGFYGMMLGLIKSKKYTRQVFI